MCLLVFPSQCLASGVIMHLGSVRTSVWGGKAVGLRITVQQQQSHPYGVNQQQDAYPSPKICFKYK